MTDQITPPLRVALFEPRIPPNTGNIARTCAAFGLPLSLIEPLGFSIDDRQLKRAGLDYWPHVDLSVHSNFEQFRSELTPPSRLIGCSRRGGEPLQHMTFHGRCAPVRKGRHSLPDPIGTNVRKYLRFRCLAVLRRMGKAVSAALNLSVACAIVCFQAVCVSSCGNR